MIIMKSTEVQTLGAVALYTTTACTDEASIIGLGSLNWAIAALSGMLYGPCVHML